MNEQTPKKPNVTLAKYFGAVLIFMLVFNFILMPILQQRRVQEASYSHFLDALDKGIVKVVQLQTSEINYITEEDEIARVYKTGIIDDPTLVPTLREKGVQFGAVIPSKPNPLLSFLLSWILPIGMFALIGYFLRRNMMKQIGNMPGMTFGSKKTAKVYVADESSITFDDVAGQDEAKESLVEIIDYLENPLKYKEIGAKCPKGVLLVGPPGTGKTLIAKAVAGEANVPFFSIAGSEFVEMFVGRGAARVRELFEQAGKNAPCIVFIDEIDTIGKSRDGSLSTNDEREQTLNQLLTEMDGFGANKGVIILAATNRPEVLDPALLRPGRFDRQVPMELPDLQGRIDILKVHAKKVKLEGEIDFHLLARSTSGASGAQLANIINEGALRAVRMGRRAVTQGDLEEAIETVIAGQQKKNAIMSDEEKRVVAYHEIGHALVAAMQTHSAPVQKITIIPRTSGALGYTMQVEEQDKYLVSRTEAENRLATIAGGRAAEEIVFNEITTGAANDIEQMTQLARSMVTKYGMSDEFGMMGLSSGGNRYLGGGETMDCSPVTAQKVDEEVRRIIQEAQEKARSILKENEDVLHKLAAYLKETETITGEEFMKILES
ncbi:MAG: ATP-dependent zinc metalloprotease FtsH [Clostridiaceae bacterium]|nr:ATP-dependent zinc metalloprotease FtsH [Clostridiaceae bacterium]